MHQAFKVIVVFCAAVSSPNSVPTIFAPHIAGLLTFYTHSPLYHRDLVATNLNQRKPTSNAKTLPSFIKTPPDVQFVDALSEHTESCKGFCSSSQPRPRATRLTTKARENTAHGRHVQICTALRSFAHLLRLCFV